MSKAKLRSIIQTGCRVVVPYGLRGFEHIFDEDAITRCGVVHEDMGDGADELAVLDNRTAGLAGVKHRTKIVCVFDAFLCVFTGKRQVLHTSPAVLNWS